MSVRFAVSTVRSQSIDTLMCAPPCHDPSAISRATRASLAPDIASFALFCAGEAAGPPPLCGERGEEGAAAKGPLRGRRGDDAATSVLLRGDDAASALLRGDAAAATTAANAPPRGRWTGLRVVAPPPGRCVCTSLAEAGGPDEPGDGDRACGVESSSSGGTSSSPILAPSTTPPPSILMFVGLLACSNASLSTASNSLRGGQG